MMGAKWSTSFNDIIVVSFILFLVLNIIIVKLGSFSNDDGNGIENVVVKCDYSKHFNVTKLWQTLKNETCMNGAQFRWEDLFFK